MRTNLKYLTVVNPTYIACIMWKDSIGSVYRYMLWDSVGETQPLGFPLYAGQPIMKNFRIEIWDINGNDITQSMSENLITSVLQGIDYRWGNDKALAGNDGQVIDFGCPIVVTDVYQQFASLQARWLGSTAIANSSWASSDGFGYQFNPPLFAINNNSEIATNPTASITGSYNASAVTINPLHIFMVCYITGNNTLNGSLYTFTGSPNMSATVVESPANVLTITLEDGNSCIVAKNTWIVLEIGYNNGDSFIRTTPVYNLGNYVMPVFSATSTVPDTYSSFRLNTTFGINAYIADIEIFNVYLGTTDSQTMITYFNNRYNFIFPLPLVFPPNSSPQPN